MCTAISYVNGDHYFGRNLDLEQRFCETITITPRNYPFAFRYQAELPKHFAMIGTASIINNCPLYYEATNEFGLSMAGLNFPGNACYFQATDQCTNLAPYELIPWILGKYKSISEVSSALQNVNIVDFPFSDSVPLSPLHWMISDRSGSIVLESTAVGLQVFNNPIHVLTNNPPFKFHLQNIANYMNLTSEEPQNKFSNNLELSAYSRGMGALGLPGDLSSSSRFVRAAFVLHNSIADVTEDANISQFFHILDSVAQQQGCVRVGNLYERTLYSSCCNTQKGIYYYKTYENCSITAVNMFHCNLDAQELINFPFRQKLTIHHEN